MNAILCHNIEDFMRLAQDMRRESQKHSHSMEGQLKSLTAKAVQASRDMAPGWKVTVASCAIAALQLSGYADDQRFATAFSQGAFQTLQNYWTGGAQSSLKDAEFRFQILSNKFSTHLNKGQGDDMRQQLVELLRQMGETLRAAATSR
jgi:hypothetical protein